MVIRRLFRAARKTADWTREVIETTRVQRGEPRLPLLDFRLLEDRLLLSAAPAAVVQVAEPASAENSDGAAADLSTQDTADQTAVTDGEATHELVFIDADATDVDQLIADLQASSDADREFDFVVLDPARDGIEQITEALGRYTTDKLDAVHFVTHGTDRAVKLGGTWLDAASLAENQALIETWSHALTADADLLFYGCELASTEVGQSLLQSISDATGADVAASTDDTGSAGYGADWVLEYAIGVVDTDVAFSATVMADWQGLLNTFTVTKTADDGTSGTLRWAMQQANSLAGYDTISFNIAGTGPHTITLSGGLGALPTITEAVLIDGWSEPDYNAVNGLPVIVINGVNTTGANGIHITASGVTVRGLVINRFDATGIYIQSGSNNVIQGNYIGTNATGNALAETAGAMADGIQVRSANNLIGGNTARTRNIIGGAQDGIRIRDAAATGNIVRGNSIGVGANKVANIANTDDGIDIGTSAANNMIGGTGAGEGNIIANNSGNGIELRSDAGTGNTAVGNAISGNGGLRIDLAANGVSSNDVGDGDSGPNNMQNFPVLTGAFTNSADRIAVSGSLNSLANTSFRIDFYAESGGTATYLGNRIAITDRNGNAQFVDAFSTSVAAGASILATATNLATGDTSEYSSSVSAQSAILVNTYSDTINGSDGLTSLREAIIAANASADQSAIFLAAGTYTLGIAGTGEELAATGDLDIRENLWLAGAGTTSTTINGNSIDRVLHLQNNATAYITGLTISGGNATGSSGGGIRTAGSTNLVVTDTIVENSFATSDGGGLFVQQSAWLDTVWFRGNSAQLGGGLANLGTTVVTNSTFSVNTAEFGAGLRNTGTELTLTNVTISGNTAATGVGQGGGIQSSATSYLTNVTITNNTANQSGGIHEATGATNTYLKTSIVSANTAPTNSNIGGTIEDQGFNLIGGVPGLGSLQNNGGDTPTHALLSTSTAVNNGDSATRIVTDQRGYLRNSGRPDIGAVEYTADGLVGHYKLDEGSGTSAIDSSAYASHGTHFGSPVYNTGKFSGAVNYSSDFDRTEVADPTDGHLDFGTGNFSLSFWFNSTQTTAGTARLVGKTVGGAGYIVYRNGSNLLFEVNDGSTFAQITVAGTLDGNWHHLAATRAGNVFTLYVDGVARGSQTISVGSVSNAEALKFGASSSSTGDFDGRLDDIRLYNRSLSLSEIVTLSGTSFTAPTLTVSGGTQVSAGQLYTLNLSATDPDGVTITSWTINWGDGTIQTVAGNPSSVTHTYDAATAGQTFNITAAATDADGTWFSSRLYVPSWAGTDLVHIYQGQSGSFIGTMAPITDGLNDHIEVIQGPNGNLYISSEQSDSVLEYTTAGVLVRTFVSPGSGGLNGSAGLAFGSDGNLYVANYLGNNVLRYNGTTGAFIDIFVPSGTGGLSSPLGLNFGPDGKLYVASRGGNVILRFSANGTHDATFNGAVSGQVEDFTFGPDGHVYAADASNARIVKLNGTTGASMGAFVASGAGGLSYPAGLAFGPDGRLYVADQGADSIRVYNGTTGAYLGDYVAPGYGGLDSPAYIAFGADHQVQVLAAATVAQSLPGAQTTSEETSITFSSGLGNAITVNDGTASTTALLQVSLSVPVGTLTLSQTTNLSFPGGANGTGGMVIWGTEADINAALNGLVYTPPANYSGTPSLSVTTALANGLQGFYEFENAGTPGLDTSVGVLQNGSVLGNAAVVVDGTRGNVLALDGSGDAISIATTFGNPQTITIGGWVNLSALSTGRREFISLDNRVHIALDDAGGVKGSVQITTGGWTDLSSGQFVAGTGWRHIMYVFDGVNDVHRLYIGGVQVASASNTGTIDWAGATTTYIGRHPTTTPGWDLNGRVDDVRIYTRALTASEVATLATNNDEVSGTTPLTVTAVNDPPAFSNLNGTPTYIENGPSVRLDADVTISDPELAAANNYSGATLTLARNGGASAQDQLAFDGVTVTTSGTDVLVSGVQVGTYNFTGGQLVVTFGATATQARVNTLLQNIVYWNSSDAPPASVQINWTFSDGNTGAQGSGGAVTATGSTMVTITAVNDPPVITTMDGDVRSYSEGSVPVLVGSADTLTDPDSSNFAGGTLTVSFTSGTDSTQDVLSIHNAGTGAGQIGVSGANVTYGGVVFGTWTGGGGGANLIVTLNTNANTINTRALVNSIAYQNTDTTNPTTTDRWIRLVLTDGDGGTSDNVATMMTVMAVNDAPSFSIGSGSTTTTPGASNDYNAHVLIQPDGKVVTVGRTWNGGNYDVVIVRYNADGSLDATFNSNGVVTTAVGAGDDVANDAYLLADGKLLVAGTTFNGVNNDFVLLRYNPDGSLDTTFNGVGYVTTPVVGADECYSLSVQADGKIVLGGFVYNGTSTYDFAAVRYNSNGTLDTTFNGTGIVRLDVTGNTEYVLDSAIQDDGKILIAGSSFNPTLDFTILRYNTDGTLDTTWGGTGRTITPVGTGEDDGFQIAVQPDGKVIQVGYIWNGSNWDIGVVRLNSNGSLDTTFNATGKLILAPSGGNDLAYDVTLQADGKILIAGTSSNGLNNDFALIRLNTNGTYDTSFNGTGIVKVAVGPNADRAEAVAVLASGAIILAGHSYNGSDYDLAVVRLTSNGALDQTFSLQSTLGGVLSFTEGGGAVVLDSNVQIVDAELSTATSFNGATLTLTRNGGANAQDVFSATGTLSSLSAASGNIVVSGTTIGTYTNASGTLVFSFNANATNALVNAAMQQIAYSNASDNPPNSVQINWTFSDGNTGVQGSGGALNATGSVIVDITAINDAPVLNPAATPVLSSVLEDSSAPSGSVGTLISSLIDFAAPTGGYDNVTDPDSASTGIALRTATTTFGAWYYSTNNGLSWSAVGPVSDTNALLLAADGSTRLYFSPNANFSGWLVNAISFRAWDQTSGSNGTYANASVNGGATAFSAALDGADLTVTPVNDIAVVTTTGATLAYAENQAATAVDNALTVSDVDNTNLTGATVSISGNYANGQDVLAFTNQLGITGTWNATTGILTLTGTTTVANYQTALRSITYVNTSDNPSTLTRTVSFAVNDGTANSTAATRSISVTATNDIAVVTTTGTTLAYTENQAATAVDNALTVSDVDNTNLTGATVTISGNYANGQDVLAFTNQLGITGTWNAATGVLTLTGTTTVANYQTALRSITYVNTSDNPSTLMRTVSFVVNDGTAGSTAATRNISITAVNDAPLFGIGTGTASTPVGDGSDAEGTSMVVQPDGKVLVAGYAYDGSRYSFAVVRYNVDGTLDTTFGGGDGEVILPLADSTGWTPKLALQLDGSIVLAGDVQTSGVRQFSVTRLDANGSVDTSFGGGGGVVYTTIGTSAIVSGVDVQSDGKIVVAGYATVSGNPDFALARYNANGSLDTSFGGGDGIVTTPIGSSTDYGLAIALQADGRVLVAGSARIGTNDQFAVARYLTDGSLDTSFGGGDGIVTVDFGISGNDAYDVLVQSDGKILLAGEGADQFALVRLNADGTLDTSFGGGDGIVTTNLASGRDGIFGLALQADGKLVATGFAIGSTTDIGLVRYNADGTLDTSFGGGDGIVITDVAGATDWGTDVAVLPDGRIIVGGLGSTSGYVWQFTAASYTADGTPDTDFGDRIHRLDNNPTFIEGGAPVVLDGDVQIFDAEMTDADDFSGATLTLARNGGASTQDQLAFDGVTVTTSGADVLVSGVQVGTYNFTGGQLVVTFGATATQARVNTLLQNIVYWNSSDAPPASVQINWTFSDGNTGAQGSGGALQATGSTVVNITAVNDGPLVTTTGTTLAYAENQAATAVDNALTVSDVDNTNLTGATVSISGNYANGQDVLAFTNQLGITGTWNATTGILTLTGTTTVANYQTALRSITYVNTSDNPSTLTRTVSFVVNDGTTSSTAATRDISVAAVNDSPTIATNSPTISEGQTVVLSSSNISTTDPDNTPAQLTYTVSGLSGGEFQLVATGATVTTFTQAQVNSGAIQFVHDGGEAAPAYSLTVSDGALSNGPAAATISFTNVNDSPTIATNSLTISEGQTVVLSSSNISTTDPDNTPAQLTYTVSGLSGGEFQLVATGATVTTFTQAQVNSGAIQFVHDGGEAAPAYSLTVSDGALSNGPSTATIMFTNVNDTPTTNNASASGLEDAASIAITLTASDVDGTVAQFQISSLPSNGTLYLDSGLTTTITSGSSYAASGNALTLYFVPSADWNGSSTFQYAAIDNASLQDATSATATFTITAVNDAPVRTAGTVSNLTVAEDSGLTSLGLGSVAYGPGGGADEAGQTLTYTVTAVPSSAFFGDIVLADGTTVVVAGNTYSLAQIQGMQLRTAANQSGTSMFQFNVADNGGTANGGQNALSQAIVLTITAVNDAPVVTTTGSTLAYTENQAATAVDNALTVSDVDNTNLTGATVSISGNYANGQDVLAFTNQLGITGTWNATTGILTLTGATTVANYQTALRSITYVNTSENPSTLTRTVSFVVNDGTTSSTAATRDISVTAVNDAPTITFGEGNKTYIENGGPLVMDGAITIADPDSTDFSGGTLTVNVPVNGSGSDRIEITGGGNITVGTGPNEVYHLGTLIGTWSGSGAPLQITFNSNATLAIVQEVARQVTFRNLSDAPSTLPRTVQFVLTDGDGGTSTAITKTINVTAVDDIPVIDLNGGGAGLDTTVNYTEGNPAVALAPAGTISDLGEADLSGLDLVLTGLNANPGQEQILFGGVTVTVGSAIGGTVTFGGTTFFYGYDGDASLSFYRNGGGVVPVADMQQLLQSISYRNLSEAPTTGARSIAFVLRDVALNSSFTATATITTTAVNDAPTTSDASGSGLEDAVSIAVTLAGADVDGTVSQFRITSLPTNGTLYLDSGLTTAIVANSAYAATGNSLTLYFDPNSNWNGLTSFQYAAIDNLGLQDATAATATFTITEVNDLPVRTGGTVSNLTVAEDSGTTTLGLSGLSYSTGGGSDESGQSLTYTITAVPASTLGDVVLADGTTVVTAGTSYTLGQLQGMQFRATANANGGPATLSFTVTDNGTTNGANEFQTLAESLTITVTEVNDQPVRTGGTVSNLTVAEDSGTTSIGLSGLAYSTGGGSDEASQTLTYTITAVPVSTLGDIVLADGTTVVNASDVLTLAQLQGLQFRAASNANGGPATFSFTATDNGATNGAADPRTVTESLTVTVTAVNDAPDLTAPAGPLSATEQTPLLLHAIGFTIGEVDAASGALTATLSVGEGTLTINVGDSGAVIQSGNGSGTVVLTGNVIDLDNLFSGGSTGTISYFNGSDTPSASTTLTLTVNDGGNTGSDPGTSGTATTEESSVSVTINVAAVADPPTQAVNDGAAVEAGQTITITTAQLQATDVDSTTTQLVYTITAIPSRGVLRLNGTALGVSDTFTQQDIDLNRVTYAHTANSISSDSFQFTLGDGSTTLTATSFALTITDATPPSLVANTGSTVVEGSTDPITQSELDYVDLGSPSASVTLTVTGGLTHGFLALIGAPTTPITTFTVEDIQNGLVIYVHSGGETTSDSFTFTVSDGQGNQLPGQTFAITVTAVNDPPTTNNVSASGTEDAASIAITLTGGDVDGTVDQFHIGSLPANGTLYLDAALTIAIINGNDYAASGNALTLYFVPNANWNGVTTFQYSAIDEVGLTDATPATATITVTAVNDAPTTNNVSASGAEDAASIAITLTGGDVDGTVDQFHIGSLPANGTLYLDAALTTAIINGNDYAASGNALTLYFVPNANWNGVTTFQYSAIDDLGLQDSSPATATLTVTEVNDQPVRTAGSVNNLTVVEDSGVTNLGLGGLAYSNGGGSDESGQTLTYTVTAVPASTLGDIVLADGTTVVNASDVLTLAQLQGLQFRAASNANGGPATFTFTVTDNGTTNGAAAPRTLVESLTIAVTEINDQPVRAAGTITNLTVTEDSGTTSLGLAGLTYSNGGGSDESGQMLTYTVTAVPASTLGDIVLADGTTVVNASDVLTLAQLQGLQFRAASNANGGPATFTFTVTDNGTTNGAADPRTITESLTVTVTAVNDPPVIAVNTLTISEGQAVVLSSANINGIDAEHTPAQLTYTVTGLTGGRFELVADGSVVASFTQAQINAGAIRFVHDGNEAPPTYSLTLSDGGLSDGPAAATILFTNVNDNPVSDAGGPYTIAEGASLTLDASGSTDPENQPLTYDWDLDNDGLYDDAFGVTPTLTWAQLEAVGINDNGTYTIGVRVTDTQSGTHTASTTLTVTNTPPTANNDGGAGYTTDEASSFTTIDVRGNDTDPASGDPLTVVSMNTTGTIGFVTNNGDGTFTYDPNGQFETLAAGQSATDTFTYTISDGDGGASTATVTITITGANDNPVAEAGGPYAISEGDNLTLDASGSTDIEGQALSYAWDLDSDGLYDDAFGVGPTLTWAQLQSMGVNDNGTYAIRVQVTDSQSGVHTASTTLTVSNTPPTANDDSGAGYITGENSPFTTIDVRGNDTDPASGDPLTIVSMNTTGTIGLVTNNGDGTFTYDPNGQFESLAAGEVAIDTFTYTISDGDGGTSTATVAIRITGRNDTPVVSPATYTLPENSPNGTVVGSPTATDVDATDVLTWSIIGGNTGNAFAIDPATGRITVADTAVLDFETQPVFTLTVQATDDDSPSLSGQTTITIRLIDLNDNPPVIDGGLTFTIDENSPTGLVVGGATASDVDTVGALRNWHIVGGTGASAFGIEAATGVITVLDRSQLDFEATPTFTLQLRVGDGVNLSAVETVTIHLRGLNDTAPVVTPGQFLIVAENSPNGTTLGQLTATDTDGIGQLQGWTIVGGTGAVAFGIDAATGQVSVVNGALLNFETTPLLTLQVTVSDGVQTSPVATVVVRLANVNEAPTLAGVSDFTLMSGATVRGNAPGLLAGGTDPDGDALTAMLVQSAAHGTVQVFADGSWSYTPNQGYAGNDTFNIAVTDGQLQSSPIVVRLTVQGAPPPTPVDPGRTPTPKPTPEPETTTPTSPPPASSGSSSGQPGRPVGGAGGGGFALAPADAGFEDLHREFDQLLDELEASGKTLIAVNQLTSAAQYRALHQSGVQALQSTLDSLNTDYGDLSDIVPYLVLPKGGQMWQALDSLSGDLDRALWESLNIENLVIGSTAIAATGLSVGYVIWLLRGGSLVLTMVTTLPTWMSFDPLPLLGMSRSRTAEDDEGESLTEMIQRGAGRSNAQAAGKKR